MSGTIVFLHERGWGRIRLDTGEVVFFCAKFVERKSVRCFRELRDGDRVLVGSVVQGEAHSVRWFEGGQTLLDAFLRTARDLRVDQPTGPCTWFAPRQQVYVPISLRTVWASARQAAQDAGLRPAEVEISAMLTAAQAQLPLLTYEDWQRPLDQKLGNRPRFVESGKRKRAA